ncbi:amidohydrolase [Rhizobium rhizosphaerae]|uniref:Amidohydrolase n=1 Tax=Xaviernesmea rhizosphaerae TaxID=1672749 RepID=A0ABX3PE87_9HYPH|nr:amidohydrolase [Xaviernesmea rhizosphaerae]OQP86387.1 amidohydrolase [Xaviernesmea rhizosphaerae]
MTALLVRGAQILTMARGQTGAFAGDMLVRDGRIETIGQGIEPPDGAEIIEGRGKLLMPGLVNAHTHSSETFFRGRYEKMPLEIWLLYAYPFFGNRPVPPRLLYLRTLLLAMESLKSGVTMLSDDFFETPGHDLDRLGLVFDAYDHAGIRANISSAVMNVPALDALPYAREIVPRDLAARLDAFTPISVQAYLEFCERVFSRLHGRANGRLRFMLAPSAPQRCTPELMTALHALSRRHGVPYHTHVLETKTQAVTGPDLYGRSLIHYLADLGLLGPNMVIAHSVWVSDADIALMGEAGVAVAHNAVSNLKLGAGIAPVRRLLDAGVAVGLGTDGLSSNDTARIFDVMRVAALVQSATGPDPKDWLSAREILQAATLGGARTALLDRVTGSLEAGKAADFILLDMGSTSFLPFNDVEKHLVYAENGGSVETVVVDGKIVMRDRKLLTVDEDAVLAEIAETVPPLLAEHARVEAQNRVLEPFMQEIHRRATAQDIGMQRYAGDMPPWRHG